MPDQLLDELCADLAFLADYLHRHAPVGTPYAVREQLREIAEKAQVTA